MKKKNNKKGFTLAELLIVVAIIAVLTAIAIPVFSAQLEKAREATDLANIRSAYAVVQSAALLHDDDATIKLNDTNDAKFSVDISAGVGKFQYKAEVTLKQTQNEWQTGAQDIGGVSIAANSAVAGGKATITFDESTNKTAITFAA